MNRDRLHEAVAFSVTCKARGNKCHFAHGEHELRRPMAKTNGNVQPARSKYVEAGPVKTCVIGWGLMDVDLRFT